MTPNDEDLETACKNVNIFIGEFYRKISLLLLGVSELIMIAWIWVAIMVYCFMDKRLAIGPAGLAIYQIFQYIKYDKSYRTIPPKEKEE